MIFFITYLISFCGMELVAWFTHKYVMHGFLWRWHKDHHVPDPEKHLQKNDYFFLIFATPGIVLIFLGTFMDLPLYFSVGLGIASYGAAYFIIHDVLIHRRLKWFRNPSNSYLKAITRAHKVHHERIYKSKGLCFGMLYVAAKYYK